MSLLFSELLLEGELDVWPESEELAASVWKEHPHVEEQATTSGRGESYQMLVKKQNMYLRQLEMVPLVSSYSKPLSKLSLWVG